MYDEREEWIEDLSGPEVPPGPQRSEAELRVVDADLWILEPESLYGFEPEEAVEQWVRAVDALGCLAEVAAFINEATLQAVQDARARAEEALRRARERVGEASPSE